ncbi:hypothetical protein V6679_11870 [Nocardia testacea]
MVAVVLFHTGMPGVGGGFVGVDVFFVISGFLVRPGAAAPTLTLNAPAAPAASVAPLAPVAPSADPGAAAVRQQIAQARAAIAASAAIGPVPSNLTSSLADAGGSKADVFVNGCVRSWREVGQAE